MNFSFLLDPINSVLKTRGIQLSEIEKDFQYAPAYYSAKFRKKTDIRYIPIFRERAREVMGNQRSLMSWDRLYALFSVLENRDLHSRSSSFAEVGSYRGGGAHFMAAVASDLGYTNRLHVIDTFEGFPDDFDPKDGQQLAGAFGETSFEDVCQYLSPWPKTQVHKGRIEGFGDLISSETFSLVHLDVDLYGATKAGLAMFLPQMVVGGAILVDDYGHKTCPGVKLAVDEFCLSTPSVFRMHLLTAQCLLVKCAP